MIKAEVITHEGNPGPNWLDRCKSAMTPLNLIAVIVAALAIFGLLYANSPEDVGRADRLPATSRSEQSTARTPLNVEQPAAGSSVQPSATGAIQSTNDASGISAPSTSETLGATSTPALNNSRSQSGTNNSQATPTDPNTVTAKQLTGTVQSIITGTTDAAQQTTKQVVDKTRKLIPNL